MANKVKKMTTKDFKEAFTSCGYDFGIWEWEGILNMIAYYANLCAERYAKQEKYEACERIERERAHAIHEYLDARHYYD